tara:strand:+ start:40 stop:435 length:396 start_codon:yes stop_codon:yes gene_type:complete
MEKKKSIEDLISSIYSLVNDAKLEYETVNKIDFNQSISSERREIKKGYIEKFKTSSDQNFEPEQKVTINKESDLASWENIKFNKNPNKVGNIEDDIIKDKFNLSLNIWIENNLKKLIELEFSNYIKARHDQ